MIRFCKGMLTFYAFLLHEAWDALDMDYPLSK